MAAISTAIKETQMLPNQSSTSILAGKTMNVNNEWKKSSIILRPHSTRWMIEQENRRSAVQASIRADYESGLLTLHYSLFRLLNSLDDDYRPGTKYSKVKMKQDNMAEKLGVKKHAIKVAMDKLIKLGCVNAIMVSTGKAPRYRRHLEYALDYDKAERANIIHHRLTHVFDIAEAVKDINVTVPYLSEQYGDKSNACTDNREVDDRPVVAVANKTDWAYSREDMLVVTVQSIIDNSPDYRFERGALMFAPWAGTAFEPSVHGSRNISLKNNAWYHIKSGQRGAFKDFAAAIGMTLYEFMKHYSGRISDYAVELAAQTFDGWDSSLLSLQSIARDVTATLQTITKSVTGKVSSTIESVSDSVIPDTDLTETVQQLTDYKTEQVAEFLEQRGIPEEVIHQNVGDGRIVYADRNAPDYSNQIVRRWRYGKMLSFGNCLGFPVFDENGTVRNILHRFEQADETTGKYQSVKGLKKTHNKLPLHYGTPKLTQNSVILTEGAMDTWITETIFDGTDVVGAIDSAAMAGDSMSELLAQSGVQYVLIAYHVDNNGVGQTSAQRCFENLAKRNICARFIDWEYLYRYTGGVMVKDINDFIKSGMENGYSWEQLSQALYEAISSQFE